MEFTNHFQRNFNNFEFSYENVKRWSNGLSKNECKIIWDNLNLNKIEFPLNLLMLYASVHLGEVSAKRIYNKSNRNWLLYSMELIRIYSSLLIPHKEFKIFVNRVLNLYEKITSLL